VPQRDVAPIGAPCWIDLFTTDPDKSRAFYAELFGWTAEEPNPDFGGYFNFHYNDRPIAGGMRNDGSTEATDSWSVYLAVENAEATVNAAAKQGSDVSVPAMPVADLGTMGVVSDPGGSRIGLWQPGTHKGFGTIDEANAPSWFELHTHRYDASVAFYRAVFGWQTHVASDVPEFRYTTLGEGEEQLAGIMDAAPFGPEHHSGWSVYFGAEDTDKTLEQIVDLGGSIIRPAEDTPYGRLAHAADTTGAEFKLVSRS
jgi:predicted enzyme related to lactoylglutathione lyase